MGVSITELLVKKEIEIDSLSGKILVVDGPMWLYQFLSSIRQPDGSLLSDSKGNVLPDCYLMPGKSTALNFAFKLHTDLGNNFIKAFW